jgi:hypothetical protein
MMKEMEHLPDRLRQMPSVRLVNSWYGTSLAELDSFRGLQPVDDIVTRYDNKHDDDDNSCDDCLSIEDLPRFYNTYANVIQLLLKH